MQAANVPTSWSATGLPDGFSLDAGTGLISGAATAAGVYLTEVVASNASGASTPLLLPIGIEDSAFSDGLGIELDVDLRTGIVYLLGVTPKEGDPILSLKRGDQVFLDIGFIKGAELQDLPITQIRLNLREFDGEASLVLSSGSVIPLGDGQTARYRILAELDSEALTNVLGNYEGDLRTTFSAIAELEWSVSYMDGVTPQTATRTSQTFRVGIDRDLIPGN